MVAFEVGTVSARTIVIAIHPRTTHELDEVLIALKVLGQHDKMIAAVVVHLLHHVFLAASRHIHLAAENGLERLLALFLPTLIEAAHIIVEFLDAKHIAMVCDGHAAHSVGHGLVNEFLDT